MSVITLNAGSGDCFGNATPTFVNSGANLYVGSDSSQPCKSWIPFVSNINNGSVLTSAILKLVCSMARSTATCKIKIGCEAADNPANPTTWNDLNARTLSTLYTLDNAVVAGVLGTEYTWDVTAAVQEIVNRGGYNAGNTLAILIQDNGSSPTSFREFATYENGTYAKAILVVTIVDSNHNPIKQLTGAGH